MLQGLDPSFFQCLDAEGCAAAIERARRLEPAQPPDAALSDRLLQRLIDGGAEDLEVEVVRRGDELDAVVRYTAIAGTQAARETMVQPEWGGKPGRERYYLVIESQPTLEPPKRYKTRKTAAGPEGWREYWVLPQRLRAVELRMTVRSEVRSLLAFEGLAERLGLGEGTVDVAGTDAVVVAEIEPEVDEPPPVEIDPLPSRTALPERVVLPEATPETTPGPLAEAIPEPVAAVEPEPAPAVAARREPRSPVEPEPVREPEPTPAPKPLPRPEPAAEPEPTPVPKPLPKPEPAAEREPAPVPKPLPEPEPAKEREPAPIPKPVPAPEPAPEREPDTRIEPVSEPEAEPVSEPDAEAVAEAAVEAPAVEQVRAVRPVAVPAKWPTPDPASLARVYAYDLQLTGDMPLVLGVAASRHLLPRVEHCWQAHPGSGEQQAVFLGAVVRPDGFVASTSVTGEMRDPELRSCLNRAVSDWTFPAWGNGAATSDVVLPFVLRVEERTERRRRRR